MAVTLKDDEICVLCGSYVPEGSMVCVDCLDKYNCNGNVGTKDRVKLGD